MTYFALICVQLLFALNTIASKNIISHIQPLEWCVLRLAFASLVFVMVSLIFFRDKFNFKVSEIILKITPMSFIGLVLGQYLYLLGLQYTNTVHASIITTMIPIICLFLNILFKDEKPNLIRTFAFMISFFGIFSLNSGQSFSFSNETFLGDTLIFTACFCVAAQIVLTRKFIIGRHHIWVTSLMFITAAFTSFVFTFFVPSFEVFNIVQEVNLDDTWMLWGIYTIVGGTILAHFLNNWSLSRLGSADVSLFIYLQPLLVGVISYILYQQVIDIKMVNSSILVASGLVLSSLTRSS